MVQAMMASKAVEGLAQNKATPYIIGGLVIAGGILTYVAVVRPILCMTGTVKCKKDKKALNIMKYKGFLIRITTVQPKSPYPHIGQKNWRIKSTIQEGFLMTMKWFLLRPGRSRKCRQPSYISKCSPFVTDRVWLNTSPITWMMLQNKTESETSSNHTKPERK